MKLLTHSQTSTPAPLKFGNGLVISSHNLMGVWLLVHAMMNVNLHESKWNLLESEMRRFVLVVTFISIWLTFQKVSLIKNQSHIKVFHHLFNVKCFSIWVGYKASSCHVACIPSISTSLYWLYDNNVYRVMEYPLGWGRSWYLQVRILWALTTFDGIVCCDHRMVMCLLKAWTIPLMMK